MGWSMQGIHARFCEGSSQVGEEEFAGRGGGGRSRSLAGGCGKVIGDARLISQSRLLNRRTGQAWTEKEGWGKSSKCRRAGSPEKDAAQV